MLNLHQPNYKLATLAKMTSMIMRVVVLQMVVFCLVATSQLPRGNANQCGSQAGGVVCPNGLCCSKWGYCGTTDDYCCTGCQSQCSSGCGGSGDGYLSDLIDEDTFNQLLKHRNNDTCPARGFYTYDAFVAAAKTFPEFANAGDTDTRKREIAAFLAQTSHQTTGGWASAPDGPFAWGYCFVRERCPDDVYCSDSSTYPCAPGQQYYGRGPIQLSWNYNYGMCGNALGLDLLNNPDLVATDPILAFTTALWFWMTPEPTSGKPSCHDVIIGNWTPTAADQNAGRLPGFGVTTNIINGGLECGTGQDDAQVANRIGFFKRYCDFYNIGYGENLDCNNQRPFGWGVSKLELVGAM